MSVTEATKPEQLAFRIADAARASGLSRTRLYDEMAAGRLGYVQAGGVRLILREHLAEYFELLKRETPQT